MNYESAVSSLRSFFEQRHDYITMYLDSIM